MMNAPRNIPPLPLAGVSSPTKNSGCPLIDRAPDIPPPIIDQNTHIDRPAPPPPFFSSSFPSPRSSPTSFVPPPPPLSTFCTPPPPSFLTQPETLIPPLLSEKFPTSPTSPATPISPISLPPIPPPLVLPSDSSPRPTRTTTFPLPYQKGQSSSTLSPSSGFPSSSQGPVSTPTSPTTPKTPTSPISPTSPVSPLFADHLSPNSPKDNLKPVSVSPCTLPSPSSPSRDNESGKSKKEKRKSLLGQIAFGKSLKHLRRDDIEKDEQEIAEERERRESKKEKRKSMPLGSQIPAFDVHKSKEGQRKKRPKYLSSCGDTPLVIIRSKSPVHDVHDEIQARSEEVSQSSPKRPLNRSKSMNEKTFAGIRKIGTKETIVRVSKEKEEPKEKEKVKRRKTIFGGKKKKEKGTKIAELNETIISPDSVGTPATLEQVLHICHHLIKLFCSKMGTSGLFRLSGPSQEVAELRDLLLDGKYEVIENYSEHTCASVMKNIYREAIHPVVPNEQYEKLVQFHDMVPKDECQLDVSELRTIFLSFDSLRYRILRELFAFLDKMTHHSEESKMTPENLAIVFSPNILICPHLTDLVRQFEDSGKTKNIMQWIIENFEHIFPESDLPKD